MHVVIAYIANWSITSAPLVEESFIPKSKIKESLLRNQYNWFGTIAATKT
jgi:hypothetical protein